MRRFPSLDSPWTATALYVAATVALTWPLATVITSQVGGDIGDTLFNSWVLLWTSGQVLRALHGDMSALTEYWNANILFPAPLTLAYSEHLTPQMMQILPVVAATGNIVLAYNLLLLSTFVLSGLGMYLLVRDLTQRPAAAFLAGLAFAFAPFRIDQFAHIEVLSSQWMPFAFLGLRRFIVGGRVRPLVWGALALLVQALSCGYYLAYFTPFVVVSCVLEIVAHGKVRDVRTWRGLVVAGSAVLLVVGIVLIPYFQLRAGGDVGVRSRQEIEFLSADTLAFANVAESSTLWGSLVRAWPHPEGQGFPGFAILGFAALAVASAIRNQIAITRRDHVPARQWRSRAASVLMILLVPFVILFVRLIVTGRDAWAIGGVVLKYRTLGLVAEIGAGLAAVLALSPFLRRVTSGVVTSRIGAFAFGAGAAAWMSLGPTVHAHGTPIGAGLYAVFFRWVPGFNGLRVPSLYFMIVTFFLAILVGFGAAASLSQWRRAGPVLVGVGMAMVLVECLGLAAVRNVPQPGPVYSAIRATQSGVVLAEFPFGDINSEIRYTFLSGLHHNRIVNGYSGFYPVTYGRLIHAFRPPLDEEEAWRALRASGATHAIVHEGPGAYSEEDARRMAEWLRRYGARDGGAFGGDRLFVLR